MTFFYHQQPITFAPESDFFITFIQTVITAIIVVIVFLVGYELFKKAYLKNKIIAFAILVLSTILSATAILIFFNSLKPSEISHNEKTLISWTDQQYGIKLNPEQATYLYRYRYSPSDSSPTPEQVFDKNGKPILVQLYPEQGKTNTYDLYITGTLKPLKLNKYGSI